jgi:hypothetical protein
MIHVNSGKIQIETISIYGLNGQLIQTKNEIFSNEVKLDASLFSSQIVIVEIRNDTESQITRRKLLVQNL